MEELNTNEISSALGASEEAGSETVDTTTVVPVDEPGTEPTEAEVAPTEKSESNELSWENDEQYETEWAKNPNKLYEAYNGLKKTITDNEKTLSQHQEDLKKVNEELGQYNELKSFLDTVKGNPKWSEKLVTFFNEFEKEMRRDRYGSDLPDEVVNKLDKLDLLENHINKQEEEKVVAQTTEIVNKEFSEIDKLCEKYALEYDEKSFIQAVQQNSVQPNMIKSFFVSHALPQIEKHLTVKTQDDVIHNQKKSTGRSDIKKSKNIATQHNPGSLQDQLSMALGA